MLSLQVYLKTANTSQEAPRFSFLNPELWSVVPCTHVEPEVTVTLFFTLLADIWVTLAVDIWATL